LIRIFLLIFVQLSSAPITEESLNTAPPHPMHKQIIEQKEQDHFRVSIIDIDISINEYAFVIQTFDMDVEAALFKWVTRGSLK
jgi:hypothetical protein